MDMSIVDALMLMCLVLAEQRAACMAQALAAAGFESLADLGCAEDWWRSTDTSNMEFHESGIVSCLVTAVTEGTLPKATHKKRQAPEQTDLESVIQVVSSKAPRTVCPCGPAARARELACEFSTFDPARRVSAPLWGACRDRFPASKADFGVGSRFAPTR